MQNQYRVRQRQVLLMALVLVLLVTAGTVMISPAWAQEATAEPPDGGQPPIVVDGGLSELAQIALIGVIGVVVTGLLMVLYRLATGLRDSYPPGTATSFEKTWDSINKKAEQTVNPYDDLMVDIAGPLVDAILKAIRERELVPVAAISRTPDSVEFDLSEIQHEGKPGAKAVYTRQVIPPEDGLG